LGFFMFFLRFLFLFAFILIDFFHIREEYSNVNNPFCWNNFL
jgi:hypothetical protein